MKKLAMLITLFTIFIFSLIGSIIYIHYTSPLGGGKVEEIDVKNGDTFVSVGKTLKEKGLIRSLSFYKFYLKTQKGISLKMGTYQLNSNMSLKEIVHTLSKDPNAKPVTITFKEGKNMRYVISQITKYTDIKEAQILSLLQNKEYLSSLVQKYWFITDKIFDNHIYYSLEGYLYPDTYQFPKNVKVEQIFETMIDNLAKKIEPLKIDLQSSNYGFHGLLTIASIAELEAKTLSDRSGVAGVFYNRLNAKMPLGSDVTTYYAAKVDMGERDLYKSELEASNAYNTRNMNMGGKLPVGPICNPDLSSIKAALYPTLSTNYYFVADKNGKVYFTKNNIEHEKMIQKLKKEGLWYTY